MNVLGCWANIKSKLRRRSSLSRRLSPRSWGPCSIKVCFSCPTQLHCPHHHHHYFHIIIIIIIIIIILILIKFSSRISRAATHFIFGSLFILHFGRQRAGSRKEPIPEVEWCSPQPGQVELRQVMARNGATGWITVLRNPEIWATQVGHPLFEGGPVRTEEGIHRGARLVWFHQLVRSDMTGSCGQHHQR